MQKKKADKFFLIVVFCLLLSGLFIFTSASLGLLSRSGGAKFTMVATKQLILLFAGLFVLVGVSNINYKLYKKSAFWIYLFAIILTLLVFVPHIGFGTKGAHRWITFSGYTFQPSELLKFGFVVYLAFWFSMAKNKVGTMKQGLIPFLTIAGISGAILLSQPDTGTFMVLCASGLAMFIAGGGRWMHMLLLVILLVAGVAGLAYVKPYVRDRITTFINPTNDKLGSSYQINQSLIAIGSGGITGRGFGQSVQKFNYLPEPIGDSIFAVASEEFGLIGASILILLFTIFSLLGLKIAARSPDQFSQLLVVGFTILIAAQSFINMAAMLGLIPLTGVPLLFVSQGGSALIVALIEVGIILNISKHQTAQTVSKD